MTQTASVLLRSPEFPEASRYEHTEKRYAVVFGATLFAESHEVPIWGRVCNISAGGLMAALPKGVRLSGRVAVEIKHVGRLFGRVAWSRDDRIGIALEEAIDPEALLTLRARRMAAWKDEVNAFSSAVRRPVSMAMSALRPSQFGAPAIERN